MVEESSTKAATGKDKPYSLHAIQLVALRVCDLAIHVDLSVPKDAETGAFTLETGRSGYDAEEKKIQVKLTVRVGADENAKPPFKLEVSIHGTFQIDESRFPAKFVEDWAEKNAPLILYPYAREQVYSLTQRAGFSEALLPLLEIPTFRITSEPAKA